MKCPSCSQDMRYIGTVSLDGIGYNQHECKEHGTFTYPIGSGQGEVPIKVSEKLLEAWKENRDDN